MGVLSWICLPQQTSGLFQRNWSTTVTHQTQSCKSRRKQSVSCKNAETSLYQEDGRCDWELLTQHSGDGASLSSLTDWMSIWKDHPKKCCEKVVYSGFVFVFFQDSLISVSVCVRVDDKVSTLLPWRPISKLLMMNWGTSRAVVTGRVPGWIEWMCHCLSSFISFRFSFYSVVLWEIKIMLK